MIKPLFDRVLLRQIDDRKSSILLPDNTADSSIAEVVALGTSDFTVAVGDKVVFNKFATSPVAYDGQNYLLIKETDILAKF